MKKYISKAVHEHLAQHQHAASRNVLMLSRRGDHYPDLVLLTYVVTPNKDKYQHSSTLESKGAISACPFRRNYVMEVLKGSCVIGFLIRVVCRILAHLKASSRLFSRHNEGLWRIMVQSSPETIRDLLEFFVHNLRKGSVFYRKSFLFTMNRSCKHILPYFAFPKWLHAYC